MDTGFLVAFLALMTIGAGAVFGYISSVRTAERLHSNTQKSTLAEDAPNSTPPGVKPVDT